MNFTPRLIVCCIALFLFPLSSCSVILPSLEVMHGREVPVIVTNVSSAVILCEPNVFVRCTPQGSNCIGSCIFQKEGLHRVVAYASQGRICSPALVDVSLYRPSCTLTPQPTGVRSGNTSLILITTQYDGNYTFWCDITDTPMTISVKNNHAAVSCRFSSPQVSVKTQRLLLSPGMCESNVTVYPERDTVPPNISVRVSANLSHFLLTFSATDDIGVRDITLFINDTANLTVQNSTLSIILPRTTCTVYAVARDYTNNTRKSPLLPLYENEGCELIPEKPFGVVAQRLSVRAILFNRTALNSSILFYEDISKYLNNSNATALMLDPTGTFADYIFVYHTPGYYYPTVKYGSVACNTTVYILPREDKTPPSLSVFPDIFIVNQSQNFSIVVSDDLKLGRITVMQGDRVLLNTSTNETFSERISFQWENENLSTGTYILSFCASDIVGNTRCLQRSFFVPSFSSCSVTPTPLVLLPSDSHPYSLLCNESLIQKVYGAEEVLVNTTPFCIEWEVNETGRFCRRFNNRSVSNVTVKSAEYNVSYVVAGRCPPFTVTASHPSIRANTTHVITNETPPGVHWLYVRGITTNMVCNTRISVVSSHARCTLFARNTTTFVNQPLTLEVTSTHENSRVTVACSPDIRETCTIRNGRCSVTCTYPIPRDYVVFAAMENCTTNSLTIRVRAPPRPDQPPVLSLVKENSLVTAIALDDVSVVSIHVFIDGVSVRTCGRKGPTMRCPVLFPTDGKHHTVRAIATDTAGNMVEREMIFS